MPGETEFVVLMAALMASNALAIDAMLPALPRSAKRWRSTRNRRQLVITTYLLGFGGAQIVYGPLSDRFGRKALLVGAWFSSPCSARWLGSPAVWPAPRRAALQGIAAAGTRVLVVAIIRDRFHGSAMAQTMSLVIVIFIVIPVLAPSIGQAVLFLADWRHIFIGLAGKDHARGLGGPASPETWPSRTPGGRSPWSASPPPAVET